MPQKKPKDTNKDYEQLGKMLTNIYESGYIDRNQAYKMSFVKGVLAGLGGVLGATILVALFLWALSFFNNVPFIGEISQNVQNTIQDAPK